MVARPRAISQGNEAGKRDAHGGVQAPPLPRPQLSQLWAPLGPPSLDEWAVAPDQPQRPSVIERSEPTAPETTPSELGVAEATGTADEVVGL